MTTFSIVEHASVGASGVSAGVIATIKDQILDAAEIWNRYFVQGAAGINIELKFEDIAGSTLATGGTSFHFTGVEGPGQEIWNIDSAQEYITGAEYDIGGDTTDITIRIDTPTILAGDFFYDPDPFARTAAIPVGETDFISLILHEIGHGLGFLGSVPGEPSLIDDPGPDITPFDDNVDLVSGERFFVGPLAAAIYGGSIPLDPGSMSHIADSGDGGFENLMDPSLLDGTRMFILPLHVAMFEDMGLPVRAITGGSDSLYGYDALSDVATLLSGNDFYDGLGGADSIDGGAGKDTLLGGEGGDTLLGGADPDLLSGGAGDDSLFGGLARDVLSGLAGDDTLLGGAGKDTMSGASGADLFVGAGKADSVSGGAGADTISGVGGNDILAGGADADVISGVAGRDTVTGDDGDDVINGGAGNDSLDGGPGGDTLTGAADADTFVLQMTHDADTINDMSAGAGVGDVIRLVGFGAAFDTFAEVLAAATDNGTDTTIVFGGGDLLVLKGVLVSELASDDFAFG